MKPCIQIQDVTFKYGDKPVLESVSLAIYQQDYLALTGHNGSGKSTLLKLMLGLLRPQQGSVIVFDEDYSGFDHHHDIGYVPQGGLTAFASFPATVLEVVLMRISSRSFFSYYSKSHRKQALEALQRVSMEAYAHEAIQNLSGGQLQRILIARELVSRPKILFLDEPTNGLDQQAIRNLFMLLDDLNDQEKMTIVMVTHHLDDLDASINRVIEVDDTTLTEVPHVSI